MVKILNCFLYAKKSYGTLSKGALFWANPVYSSRISSIFPSRMTHTEVLTRLYTVEL